MSFEGLWIQGVIGRKPDAETQLAAFGLMFSLSVLIETPVIMLLATSNALSRDRQSFRVLWRFMMGVNIFVTAVAILMAFTPLLDFYLGSLLNVPGHIIEATRPGMKVMILWGAFIGYRRFHQGIIIRQGNTRYIAFGTVLRALVSSSVAIGLGAITTVAGAVVGAIALLLAMAAEMLYTYIVSRPDVKRMLATPPNPARPTLTQRDALRFHLPLAATSVITILVSPVIERGLASMPDAAQSLAAWPVIFTIFLITRSGGMAYQEVVISLNDSEAQHRVLRNFTIRLGLALSFIMTVFAFTPAILVYQDAILQVPAHLHELVLARRASRHLAAAADDLAELPARLADAQPQNRRHLSGDRHRLRADRGDGMGRHRARLAWHLGRLFRLDHRDDSRIASPVFFLPARTGGAAPALAVKHRALNG